MTSAELDAARTLRRVCEHEAAHAVVARLLGAKVTAVEIAADGGGRTVVEWPAGLPLDERRRRQAVCAAASELTDPDPIQRSSADDRRQVRGAAGWSWTASVAAAKRLLTSDVRWRVVPELVRELMDRGRLDAVELNAIFRRGGLR